MPCPVPSKPEQLWSASNLCRRQKLRRHFSHCTGISSFCLQLLNEHLLVYTCKKRCFENGIIIVSFVARNLSSGFPTRYDSNPETSERVKILIIETREILLCSKQWCWSACTDLQLICAFVFAQMKSSLFHNAAHIKTFISIYQNIY